MSSIGSDAAAVGLLRLYRNIRNIRRRTTNPMKLESVIPASGFHILRTFAESS
jgi:uncharacterized membrane protein YidH (DUF202 family)